MIAQTPPIKIVAGVHACHAALTFIIGMIFYVFTTDESKYGGSDCVILRAWSYRYGVLMLIQALAMMIIIIICLIASYREQLTKWTNIVNYSCGILGLILLIIIDVAYFQRESCGDLTILVLIYTWIIIIELTIGFFCFMCCAARPVGASPVDAPPVDAPPLDESSPILEQTEQ